METYKLFDSELKLMHLIWKHSPISAKDLSLIATMELEWNKNTTYTVLKKLIEKKAIQRDDPNFICIPLITIEQVQQTETVHLINRLFNGSKKAFFSSFVGSDDFSKEELEELKKIIEKSGE